MDALKSPDQYIKKKVIVKGDSKVIVKRDSFKRPSFSFFPDSIAYSKIHRKKSFKIYSSSIVQRILCIMTTRHAILKIKTFLLINLIKMNIRCFYFGKL